MQHFRMMVGHSRVKSFCVPGCNDKVSKRHRFPIRDGNTFKDGEFSLTDRETSKFSDFARFFDDSSFCASTSCARRPHKFHWNLFSEYVLMYVYRDITLILLLCLSEIVAHNYNFVIFVFVCIVIFCN